MSRAGERAVARGVVGSVPYRFSEGSNGVVDATEWAVAEFGVLTASGYTTIKRTFERKAEALAYRKELTNNARHSLGEFIILKRNDDGTWSQWLSTYEKRRRAQERGES